MLQRCPAGGEAEFVVAPDARGRGIGTALLETLLAGGATLFWAHGDAPAARALAAAHGLTAVRELLHFVGEVSTSSTREGVSTSSTREGVSTSSTRERVSTSSTREGVSTSSTREGVSTSSTRERVSTPPRVELVEAFVPQHDEDEWVALNARTFAAHPEQGSVTRADVEQLETEPWFSAENFLVLRRDGRMIGYCWLKVEAGRGEFYVVGVDPDLHGEHLGSLLFDAGLARLRELGIRSAHLYVEGDNEPALRLYRARGFSQDSVDIQYSLS